jgi:hypothetical protein
MKKVAYYMTGEVRTWESYDISSGAKHTYKNPYESVTNLKKLLWDRGIDLDIYGYTWDYATPINDTSVFKNLHLISDNELNAWIAKHFVYLCDNILPHLYHDDSLDTLPADVKYNTIKNSISQLFMHYFVCNDIPLDYDWYIKSRWDVIHTVWEDSLDDLVDIINNGQDDSIHCLARNFRIKDGDIGFLDFAYMFDNIFRQKLPAVNSVIGSLHSFVKKGLYNKYTSNILYQTGSVLRTDLPDNFYVCYSNSFDHWWDLSDTEKCIVMGDRPV